MIDLNNLLCKAWLFLFFEHQVKPAQPVLTAPSLDWVRVREAGEKAWKSASKSHDSKTQRICNQRNQTMYQSIYSCRLEAIAIRLEAMAINGWTFKDPQEFAQLGH